jgi:hypothetical protein
LSEFQNLRVEATFPALISSDSIFESTHRSCPKKEDCGVRLDKLHRLKTNKDWVIEY